ncbi:hypothetical protein K440DRAFT_639301 [Wilcoxina mikolae CBS 423.85]|nr:hypothetical protein K440DRAFT_639301 [Wilcoxina mikolae CBS 423.85]
MPSDSSRRRRHFQNPQCHQKSPDTCRQETSSPPLTPGSPSAGNNIISLQNTIDRNAPPPQNQYKIILKDASCSWLDIWTPAIRLPKCFGLFDIDKVDLWVPFPDCPVMRDDYGLETTLKEITEDETCTSLRGETCTSLRGETCTSLRGETRRDKQISLMFDKILQPFLKSYGIERKSDLDWLVMEFRKIFDEVSEFRKRGVSDSKKSTPTVVTRPVIHVPAGVILISPKMLE